MASQVKIPAISKSAFLDARNKIFSVKYGKLTMESKVFKKGTTKASKPAETNIKYNTLAIYLTFRS